ncbi:Rha family transcriptional regulator [Neisseria montereyensis]|uniref:Rha family transcriptional regulator n=1 Tax=Neisseria montereyensis TaxID=2973938 RepID=A0ABT2FDG7_9NEIS|nr:Rha family transcriptional regulator [Neisseria montereyensis]MCS4534264.1 Rha family transcriptional regulator [Neisseria montereyensis]
MNSQPLVRHSGNRLITTSLAISNHFNRKHKDILRAIENLECSQEFRERNFAPTSYKTSQGKIMPAYEITRDGFVFLCMGFTGTQAAQWKEKYIAAFNALEAEVNKGGDVALLQQQNEALKQELAIHAPKFVRLAFYHNVGLEMSEMRALTNRSARTVRRNLKRLAACGLTEYRPDPRLSAFGKLGNLRRRQNAEFFAAQQSLSLGE